MSEGCSIHYTKIGGLCSMPHRCQFVGSIFKKLFERSKWQPLFRQSYLRDEAADVDVEQSYGGKITDYHMDP